MSNHAPAWHSRGPSLGRFSRRRRALALAAALLVVAVAAGVWLARPAGERRIRQSISEGAARRGLIAEMRAVRIGLLPPLRVEGLSVTAPGRFRAVAESVRVSPALWGHGLAGLAWRVRVGRAFVSLPGGVEAELAPFDWTMRRTSSGFQAWLRADGERVDLEWERSGEAAGLRLRAADLRLTNRLTLRHRSLTVSDLGNVVGELLVRREGAQEVRVEVRGRSLGMRLAPLDAGHGAFGIGDGLPTDATLELSGRLWPREGALEVSDCRLTADDATLQLRGRLWGGATDPQVELVLAVDHLDFARLLATAGLDLPAGALDLGSAALDATVAGKLRDPGSFVVKQHLDFAPPATPIPALEKLKRAFVYEARPPRGPARRIVVGPDSPDFLPLEQVPPLFLRILLLAEDTSYYGHRGIDLAEVPRALATNWVRGTSARGASTISQQVAKNLFLTRERSLSRKLQELALSLLLDATLGKDRLLEIYLNIIEWGPNLYGVRPAARHYFGKEAGELTLKEMAFLVCLIPGPLKYQRSFAHGELSPAFETMVATLLGKARSIDAIGEEEYQSALGETLLVRPNGREWSEAPADAGAGADPAQGVAPLEDQGSAR